MKIRDVLEKLVYRTQRFMGRSASEEVAQALAEIEGIVVPTTDELKKILIKESNKWSGAVDGIFDLEGDQACSIHSMLKGRVK